MARRDRDKQRAGRAVAQDDAERASLRERAKAETREALIDAAAAEFGARGLDAPSLDAICARAGHARRLYALRDREHLVAAVMQRALGGFLDTIIANGEQPHDLERTVRRFADAIAGIAQLRGARSRGTSPVQGGVPFHRILEASERSVAIRKRFIALLRARRVAKTAAARRCDRCLRRGRRLLVTLAFASSCPSGRIPFDAAAARRCWRWSRRRSELPIPADRAREVLVEFHCSARRLPERGESRCSTGAATSLVFMHHANGFLWARSGQRTGVLRVVHGRARPRRSSAGDRRPHA
jgi:AcrR family transcriptional regulator